jgi:hypothetical protein
MFQPLLGESAPARRKVAATGALAMCHEPARQEKNTDAGTQRTRINLDAT